MIEVIPFHGLLYNTKVTGPLIEVTAPPYDVIPPALQESLYQKNPHNVVRLILGKEFSTDSEMGNRYTRASDTFRQWLEEGILVRDPQPGFYLYSQEYEFEGGKFCRTGFFARVKAEAFSKGNLLPHEFTLAKAKTDRTRLLNACHANFSPIFGLYSDPEGNIDSLLKDEGNLEPLSVIDDGSVVHRIWRLNNPTVCQEISNRIRDKKIYIADGHHRVPAEQRREQSGLADAGVLILVDQNVAEGILILLQNFRMLLEQGQAMQQQIAKVARVQDLQTFLINLVKVLSSAIGEFDTFIDPLGRQALVLPALNDAHQLLGWPFFRIDLFGIHDLLEQPDLIIAIKDGEV